MIHAFQVMTMWVCTIIHWYYYGINNILEVIAPSKKVCGSGI